MICGYNTGQHMYVDASYGLSETNPAMTITTTGQFQARLAISISQFKHSTAD